jgi:NADP-dependent aldehyde dehydrogenase
MHAAVVAGLKKVGLSPDIFALVEGTNPEITHWIASHPDITAIGFTGSGKVGKILMEISAKREVPIPVYAEMGSLNPVFFSPKVLAEKAADLAKAAMDSATLGSGQFCTKPGILIVPTGAEGDAFISEIESYLATIAVAPLLNKGIADRFTSAIVELAKSSSLKTFTGKQTDGGFGVTPTVFVVDWADAFKNKELLEEHFGPTTVIIRADFASEDVAKLIEGLSQIAGRVIMNGFPTAVAVTAAMQHGGQFPSSSSHTTSVGLDSIYRFLRPVAYQNFIDDLLPPALQESNPLGINRVING